MHFAPRGLAAQLIGAPRWLVALIIIAIFLLHPLTQFGKSTFLSKLEAIAYDTRLKFTLPKQGDPQVVIIDIDEASLAKEGRWPWPRDKLARESGLALGLLSCHSARSAPGPALLHQTRSARTRPSRSRWPRTARHTSS